MLDVFLHRVFLADEFLLCLLLADVFVLCCFLLADISLSFVLPWYFLKSKYCMLSQICEPRLTPDIRLA